MGVVVEEGELLLDLLADKHIVVGLLKKCRLAIFPTDPGTFIFTSIVGPISPKRSAIPLAVAISWADHSEVPQYKAFPVLIKWLNARTVSSRGV